MTIRGVHAMREAIRVTIHDHQRRSEALHWQSTVINGNQRQSMAINGTPLVINGNHL